MIFERGELEVGGLSFSLLLLRAPLSFVSPLSLSNYYLSFTSSRNASLMARMRSMGTLATLAHCFLFLFLRTEREEREKRERKEGEVVSSAPGGKFHFFVVRVRVVGFCHSHNRIIAPLIPIAPHRGTPFYDLKWLIRIC